MARALGSKFSLAILVFAIVVAVQGARGQDDVNTDVNTDVHVVPRVQPRPPAESIPGTLDTHTRPFKSDVDLVLVPVTVTDSNGRIVTGLGKDNFSVFQDKREEAIQTFSSDDAPVSVGLIFDMSGSMTDKIDKSRDAIVQFMQTANPDDQFLLIGFSNKPTLLSDWTSRPEEIQNSLLMAKAQGRTALLDAVYLAATKMRNAAHRRKALLIISDGGDNNSRYTEGELKNMVDEADLQIYSIGIYDMSPATMEEREGPTLLSDLSDATGGRTFTLENPNDLPDVAAKIGLALRNEYVLGYKPTPAVKDGKWHKIKVKLSPPKGLPHLDVYAKQGYYAQGR
jgi:Ca-activated chloride channel family protein